jgi:hypothetical protein
MHCSAQWKALLTFVGLVACTGLVTLVPASATSGPGPDLSIPLPCKDSNPCLNVTNYGSGIAVKGSSGQNSGIVGATKEYSVNDPGNTPGYGGVVGIDLSQPSKSQQGSFNFTAGLFGASNTGDGVIAYSNQENGIVGLVFNESLTSGFGTGAVFGVDASIDGGVLNEGVVGESGGTGVEADGFAPNEGAGALQFPALQVRCGNGGPAIIASNGFNSPTADIMSLDCNGNLSLAGTLTTEAQPLSVTRASTGAKLISYPVREAQPTIEDVGEARLVDGVSSVALDPTFATTLDQRAAYVIFLTPEGDSHGLYVAQKTPHGFTVRENEAGRSTLSFAYRIVGKPYDSNAPRLPLAETVRRSLQGVRGRVMTRTDIAHALQQSRLRGMVHYFSVLPRR